MRFSWQVCLMYVGCGYIFSCFFFFLHSICTCICWSRSQFATDTYTQMWMKNFAAQRQWATSISTGNYLQNVNQKHAANKEICGGWFNGASPSDWIEMRNWYTQPRSHLLFNLIFFSRLVEFFFLFYEQNVSIIPMTKKKNTFSRLTF